MRHVHRMRVPFGDVDHAGIVYYPRLFHYFHLAYEGFFHDGLGKPFQEMFDQRGVVAPVVACNARFRAPLRHGETLAIEVWISRLGRRSWTLRFELRGAGESGAARAEGEVTHAFAAWRTLEPVEIPLELRDAVAPWVEAEPEPPAGLARGDRPL